MINGIYAATLSVLDKNLALNSEKTIKYAENLIDKGCHGVVFFGSTGQSQLISLSEKIQLINLLPKSNYRDKFIIGTGLNSLVDNINLIKIAKSNGFNKFLIMPPAYYKYSDHDVVNFYSRITRAQSMDILSSQANLAGYKAVVDSFASFQKAIPMMMTAAGTISAAKVLVVGAGVAGLQAIATAKRMGAIVFATDVRLASKEQVESLGGKFLSVEGSENLETEGGYAKETSNEFKKKQEELLKNTLKKIDIVICTALIPGKKAPIIIKKDMIDGMKSGSIIYDLAAAQGGNSELTKVNEIIDNNGVKIMGETNILNKLPVSASNLYSKNMFNFINNLFSKEKNSFEINLEDEIIEKTKIK